MSGQAKDTKGFGFFLRYFQYSIGHLQLKKA